MTKLLIFLATLPVSVGMCQGGKAPDVHWPTRLDVIMTSPHPQAACDQMGGKLVHVGKVSVCRNVDY